MDREPLTGEDLQALAKRLISQLLASYKELRRSRELSVVCENLRDIGE